MAKRKNHGFKVRDQDNPNGICNCLDDGQISDECVEKGICPSLKIIAVYKGVRKEKGTIQKEKKAVGKQKTKVLK